MFWTVTMSLLAGLGTATKLFALTLLFALPLGLIVAFGSMSKWAPFSRLAKNAPGLAAFRPVSALTNIIVHQPLLQQRAGRCHCGLTDNQRNTERRTDAGQFAFRALYIPLPTGGCPLAGQRKETNFQGESVCFGL